MLIFKEFFFLRLEKLGRKLENSKRQLSGFEKGPIKNSIMIKQNNIS